MTDVLQEGARWLDQTFADHASQTVTCVRGEQSVELQVTVGRTEFEQTDQEGVVTSFLSRDYLVQASKLVLGGQVTVPLPGDRWRETVGDKVHVYQVLDSRDGVAWRWADAYHLRMRVHTKRIDTEAA